MKIAGKNAIYHKLVFEVRYEQGYLYLDRCGTAINRILASNPDWIIKDEVINANNAPMVNIVNGMQFNFGFKKYDFALEQPINRENALTRAHIDEFITQVESISETIHEELSLKKFVREGFRIWFIFEAKDQEASQDWISNLGIFNVVPSFSKGFDGTLESTGHVVTIRAPERSYRISINPVERLEAIDVGSELKVLPRTLPKGQREAMIKKVKAQNRLFSNPGSGVMIDVDAYIEQPIEVVPGDFIENSLKMIEQKLPMAFHGGMK